MGKLEDEIRKRDRYADLYTEYVNELRAKADKTMEYEFAELRKFSIDTVREAGIFYVGNAKEMIIPRFIDFMEDFGVINKQTQTPMFSHRYMIPIRDSKGKVINLVGYTNESKTRYVYASGKYYRRRDTLYGLENIGSAYEKGYAIVTEGITDAIALRNIGFKEAFGWCGTHRSKHNIELLDRCRHGVIKIPDRDEAGARAEAGWNVRSSIVILVLRGYKDVDAMCKAAGVEPSIREQAIVQNREVVKYYMNNAINELESRSIMFKGKKVVTIM